MLAGGGGLLLVTHGHLAPALPNRLTLSVRDSRCSMDSVSGVGTGRQQHPSWRSGRDINIRQMSDGRQLTRLARAGVRQIQSAVA